MPNNKQRVSIVDHAEGATGICTDPDLLRESFRTLSQQDAERLQHQQHVFRVETPD